MALINCKIELSLKSHENCILSSAGTAATFAITDTKLYVHFKNWRQCKFIKIIKNTMNTMQV